MLSTIAIVALAPVMAADGAAPTTPSFSAPVQIKAAGEFIRVEQPGYAAPCWHDVDEDGLGDLVVGQFNGGKMNVYRNLGDGTFAEGEWIEANGKVAQVPGVW